MISIKNKDKKEYNGFLIYKLTNPNNKVYIGVTINLKKRIKVYRDNLSAAKNQKNLYESIKKWGIDKHKIEIIYREPANKRVDISILSDKEQMFIYKEYINNGKNLLNIIVKGAVKGRNTQLINI